MFVPGGKLKQKTVFVILSWLAASAVLFAQSPCIPPTQEVAPGAGGRGQGRGPAAPPAPRDLTINAIPGVVAAGGKWSKVWQQAGNSADGILPYKGDSVLVAQEDYDTVLKIDKDGKTSVYVANAKGIGSISMDHKGRLYGAHRTERPGSTKPDRDSIVNAITLLAPERKTIADKWSGGSALTVRPNDLTADNQGGAYFTQGCLYYASPKGATGRRGKLAHQRNHPQPRREDSVCHQWRHACRFRREGTWNAREPPRFRRASGGQQWRRDGGRFRGTTVRDFQPWSTGVRQDGKVSGPDSHAAWRDQRYLGRPRQEDAIRHRRRRGRRKRPAHPPGSATNRRDHL